jgi:hypothetical protein
VLLPGRDFGCLYSVFIICCLLFAAALESEVLLTLLPSCDLQGSGKQGKHVANGHSNISTVYWVLGLAFRFSKLA